MTGPIQVDSPEKWSLIRDAKLNVVVDPMVFRSADVFLRGAAGMTQSPDPQQSRKMWAAISANVGSLCTFFDELILEERLPLYDYDSFPYDIQTGKSALIAYCNEDEEVLVDVCVKGPAYDEMKKAALARMGERTPIEGELAQNILDEMSAFDYEWRPDIWPGPYAPTTKKAECLEAFRFGGLLYSGYAQRTGADHVLQPKRARLYTADMLGVQRIEDEEKLFTQLAEALTRAPAGFARTGDLPPVPTFLPLLLLHDDATPRDLLRRALRWRKEPIVAAYRDWRRQALNEIDHGRVPRGLEHEIERIAGRLNAELVRDKDPTGKLKAGIALKIAALGPELSLEASIEQEIRWGELGAWVIDKKPRYRYRKLLMRMVLAQASYIAIDRHLSKLWHD